MKKPNRRDLTERNLGPIKALRARVKSLEIRQKVTDAQLDEFRSRLENLTATRKKAR